MKRGIYIAAVAVSAALSVAPSAMGAVKPGWLTRSVLGATIGGSDPTLVSARVLPNGTTMLLYNDLDSVSGKTRIRIAQVQPNGRAVAPYFVSDTSGAASDPAITFDKNGNGAIVYSQKNASNKGVIKLRRISPKGVLNAVTTTVSSGLIDATQPSVGLDGYAAATVAWIEASTPVSLISKRFDQAGVDLPLGPVSPGRAATDYCRADSTSCSHPLVFSQATGASTIVWLETLKDTLAPSIRTTQISRGDEIDLTPQKVLTSTYDSGLEAKMTAAGAVQLVWLSLSGGARQVQAARISTGGTPGEVQALSLAEAAVKSAPSLSVSSSGAALVTWVDGVGGTPSEVTYRRLSTSGVKSTANGGRQVVSGNLSGSVTAAGLLSNSGSVSLFWRNLTTEIRYTTASSKDVYAPHGLYSTLAVPTGLHDGTPMLATGADGTVSATWLYTAGGSQRRFITQVLRTTPKVSSVTFPAKLKSRQRNALIKFSSTKGGSALITIEGASRSVRFRKASTRAAVLAGSSTVRFNTKGLVKGIYRVTIVLVDAAGLSATKTTKLIVTH
ncbi:MAG: hypothetical protein NTY57_02915 [Solirubrobacterales bacterium]|nr:hypothetical protein [Solirubrobacterales bacterium]